jgi:aryl-alcohol dehydrogenase-like predicted oxidoreductase
MQYRKLGNSGLIVSIGLGSMQFGRGMKMGNLGQAATSRLVRRRWIEA